MQVSHDQTKASADPCRFLSYYPNPGESQRRSSHSMWTDKEERVSRRYVDGGRFKLFTAVFCFTARQKRYFASKWNRKNMFITAKLEINESNLTVCRSARELRSRLWGGPGS